MKRSLQALYCQLLSKFVLHLFFTWATPSLSCIELQSRCGRTPGLSHPPSPSAREAAKPRVTHVLGICRSLDPIIIFVGLEYH